MNRRKYKKLMEMVSMIKPTSKAALKHQCLLLSNLDIDKADRMYDFLIKDMEEIPAVDAASKSFVKIFGEQASGVMGWFRENQDVIVQVVNLVRGFFGKGGAEAPAPLPPINE